MTDSRRVVGRIALAGLAAAFVVVFAGRAVEIARFGADDGASAERIRVALSERFDASAALLQRLTSSVATSHELARGAARDPAAARRLFALVGAALPADAGAGVTVYVEGLPVAWSGLVVDLPRERIDGPAGLLLVPGALGPRLVRIDPIVDRDRRVGSVVAELALGPSPKPQGSGDRIAIATAIAPVSLRTRSDLPAGETPYSFAIQSDDGQVIAHAELSPADLATARARWRHGARAVALATLAVTMLSCVVPLLAAKRRVSGVRALAGNTALVGVLLVSARLAFWAAAAPLDGAHSPYGPLDLLLSASLLAGLAWLLLDLVERRRVTAPRPPLRPLGARSLGVSALLCATAGVFGFVVLWGEFRVLQTLASQASVDLLRFSLHPVSATHLMTVAAIVLLHAGVIWSGALLLRLGALVSRRQRSASAVWTATLSWIAGISAVAFLASSSDGSSVPVRSLLAPLLAMGAGAATLAHPRGWFRRASQAARLGVLFLALVVPAVAMYPAMYVLGGDAKERLVADRFGPQAATLRDDLQNSMRRALEAIDAVPSLGDFIGDVPIAGEPTTDPAFQLWSSTDLARFRLASAIELYAADGRLASRFALVPDYAETSHEAATCEWDIVDEASPFGSSERHILRASRAVCERGRRLGSVVVRAMLDYRTLPFVASRSPYLQSPGLERRSPDLTAGLDVEFVMYGWSRAPIHVSGTGVWPLSDATFERMVASREPNWETLTREGRTFRVYLLNDRGGIYAIGYPVVTWFGHLVNLAELMTLVGALYLVLLAGATLVTAFGAGTPVSGRALLHEVRSSFYRKLFLAFVAGAVVPVVVLALATRAYYAGQFRAEIQEGALQTATVAQRLVEDYAALQRRETGSVELLDDQFMVLVGRAIDQSVNLFDRQRLQATSDRDLFATGLLSTRTPSDVYQAIVLDRLPTFVGEEEAGGTRYLVAAAPVGAGGREGIVTVPQTLREQEVERQIDDLDRRVLFASVLFVLVGASLGYWMAERIADPVSRLTRATRRVARGDLDARVAAASSDELGRLVEDFNRMAADLQRQRADLERTQRLEAWAEMARLVAHDIKNPLTPIQLSAEHAKRVNLDRGRPLSPVLDQCVDAILKQVALLRRIAGEFSSFASSPPPRIQPTALPDLFEEVLEPYRAAVADRIGIDVHSVSDLPEVAIDRTLFARALTNVIENALHAMPGNGRLTITADLAAATASPRPAEGSGAVAPGANPNVHSPSAERFVIVEVADTGVGIDPEALAKIFEPYFSTKATGTGLGMTIAKRNVELVGGSIAIRSELGAGTSVTMTLPVARREQAPPVPQD